MVTVWLDDGAREIKEGQKRVTQINIADYGVRVLETANGQTIEWVYPWHRVYGVVKIEED